MRTRIFHFIRSMLIVWAVLCSSVTVAQTTVTLNVTTPGTLAIMMTDAQQQSVTDIKVTGSINFEDLCVLATMSRQYSLANIDLKGADMVEEVIPSETFVDCTVLKSIKLPKNVKALENHAFWRCYNVEAYEFPETLEHIYYECFSDNFALREMTLPASITYIDNAAFWECHFTDFTCMAAVPPVADGNPFTHLDGECTLHVPDYYAYQGEPWNRFAKMVQIGSEDKIFNSTIHSGYVLPSSRRTPSSRWEADTWVIWGGNYYENGGIDGVIVGTPPVDAKGRNWYDYDYELTNSKDDVLPNGNPVVWENHMSPYGCNGDYYYFPDYDILGDIYLRRTFTFDGTALPNRLLLSCAHDDPPVEYYINGVLVYENHTGEWHDGTWEIELTPEQIALIHTDGTPNILAAHASQNWGGYMIDCGLYEPDVVSYHITSGTTCEVTGAMFASGEVTIPSKASNGDSEFTVTHICENAFRESDLTKITLPATVENIDNWAFWNCYNLQEVVMPANLKRIGREAFQHCGSLQTVVLPDDVDVDWGAFGECHNLTVIANRTIYMYDESDGRLMCAPKDITEYEVAMGTHTIYSAFYGCSDLTTVTLSQTVERLYGKTFGDCTSLTDIYIKGKMVPEIQDGCFEGVDKSKITLHVWASQLQAFKERWGTEFKYVTTTDIEPMDLVVNVENHGGLADAIAAKLSGIAGASAFDVRSIKVTGNINHDDLRYLGGMTRGYYILSAIDLSEASIGERSIPSECFRDNDKLVSIVLPKDLEEIGWAAFYNSDALVSIHIPASVTFIRDEAFCDCNCLTTVTGLEGAKHPEQYLQWRIFMYSDNIQTPIYNDKVFFYLPRSFSGEYEVPAGIQQMTGDCMRECRAMTSLVLPASMQCLGNDVLRGCSGLTEIYCHAIVPPYLHEGSCEYDFNKDQVTVYVPSVSLDDYKAANEWCDFRNYLPIAIGELVENFTINVPTAGTLSDELLDAAATEAGIDKTLIAKLTVTGSINADDWNWLMDLNTTCYYISALDMSGATISGVESIDSDVAASMNYKTLALPEGITVIESNAFRGKTRLQNITLPQSLTTIGAYAFANSSIMRLVIPDNVTEMGDRVFQGAVALTYLEFGQGMTAIQECMAEGAALDTLVLKNVQAAGWRAFSGSRVLKDVYCYMKTVPETGEMFGSMDLSKTTLHVAENKTSQYKGWYDFGTIVGDLPAYPEYEITVNISDWNTFSDDLEAVMVAVGCEDKMDIAKLTVTGNLSHNDVYAIRNNLRGLRTLDISGARLHDYSLPQYGLERMAFEQVVLPNTLQRIEWEAFQYCSNLVSIHIPASVVYVAPGAFMYCTSLTTVTGGEGVVEYSEYDGYYFHECNKLSLPVIMGNSFYYMPASYTGAYEMPEEVTVVLRDAFCEAVNMTELSLPSSLRKMWGNVFSGLTQLHDIYCYATDIPYTYNETFNNFDRSSCTLHVYEELVQSFQGDENWCDFNIVGDLGSAGSYGEMAAEDYTALCSLYNALGGTSWKHRWNVDKNSVLPAAWYGVTFENGHVTAIDLSGNNLTGDIRSLALSLPSLIYLNLSDNHLTGDVYPLASQLKALTYLNLQDNELSEVSKPLSQTIGELYLDGQYYGDLGTKTLPQALETQLPSIFYYDHANQGYASRYTHIGGPWLVYPNDETAGYNQFVFWGDDITNHETRGGFHVASGQQVAMGGRRKSFTFNLVYEAGDTNLDDVVNVLDLQQTLNWNNRQDDSFYYSGGRFCFNAADTYEDGDITVQDIVCTVNILLGITPQQVRAQRAKTRTTAQAEAWLTIENGDIVLNSTRAVAALDLRIDGTHPEAINWQLTGFMTAAIEQEGGTHAIVYSMNGNEIPAGRTVIGHCGVEASIADAVLSDKDARLIQTALDNATGIDGAAASGKLTITNMGGVNVPRAGKGVYILHGNGVTKKVTVK